MSHVELNKVSKTYGAVQAIADLDLSVEKGSFTALLGPSGCGKSTLLRMIAGLEDITSGRCLIDGKDVTNVPPAKRGIAMVFQSYALYPHMTVGQNIAFSMSIAGMSKTDQQLRTQDVAQMLQLEDLLDRKPAQLSGGQRQRVAIGRALVREPEVFLFDEPLSNLDAMLRVQMRLELAKLHGQLKSTMIYVTHDQVEAMTLAARIVVLDKGQISQVGTPLELYNQPANKFVASFIGSPAMNFFEASVSGVQGRNVTLALPGGGTTKVQSRRGNESLYGSEIEVGVRPEHFALTNPDDKLATFAGKVLIVERLGNATVVYVETAAGQIIVEGDGELSMSSGTNVGLTLNPARSHLFGADSVAA